MCPRLASFVPGPIDKEMKVFSLPSAAFLAISTAALFISTTLSSKPYSAKTDAIAPNVFVTATFAPLSKYPLCISYITSG